MAIFSLIASTTGSEEAHKLQEVKRRIRCYNTPICSMPADVEGDGGGHQVVRTEAGEARHYKAEAPEP